MRGPRTWRFATVVHARLEPRDGWIDVIVACGGHPPPLILRADGRCEPVPVRGTLVGALPEIQVSDVAVRLERGDLLLLYTDGVLEVDPDQPALGERLLVETLRAHAGADAAEVVAAVERAAVRVQEGDPRDDIALLALRVR
jgi:serine phosphatase RsbU (regulator of sigma subunit)